MNRPYILNGKRETWNYESSAGGIQYDPDASQRQVNRYKDRLPFGVIAQIEFDFLAVFAK